MTGGRVSVGSGTLYNLLEQFLDAGMIIETKVEGRKRTYLITEKGKEMLDAEYTRIMAQAQDYHCCDPVGKKVSVLEFLAVGTRIRALFLYAVKGGGSCRTLIYLQFSRFN